MTDSRVQAEQIVGLLPQPPVWNHRNVLVYGLQDRERLIDAIASALAAAAHARTCEWTQPDPEFDARAWDTSCGESYVLFDGTLDENRHKHCPFCGGTITIPALLPHEETGR